jgi:hypothetical protein
MLRTALLVLLFASFPLTAQPFLRSIQPSSSTQQGDRVTLRGEGLLHLCPSPCPKENSYVLFGEKEGQIVSITDTEAVVIAPPHRPGAVSVYLGSRAAGSAGVLPSGFYYYSEPDTFGPGSFLIPFFSTGDTPGAYGSLWRTTLTVWHRDLGEVQLNPKFLPRPGDANPSRFLRFSAEGAERVAVQLRIQDVSRQGETYGVEIPVVRETDLRIEHLMLDQVPTDARFRVALRIYMVNGMFSTGSASQQFRVRVFRAGTNEQLAEYEVDVRTPYPSDITIPEPLYPAIHQDHDFVGSHPAVTAANRVRIEIDPGARFPNNPVPLYWAFVSVTHRDTQHVTIISPQ